MQNTKYTPDETKLAVELYAAGCAVDTIGTQLNKSMRSVVAKLVREGVYVKPAAEVPRANKTQLVLRIAECLKLDAAALHSLTAAQHSALTLLCAAVESKPQ